MPKPVNSIKMTGTLVKDPEITVSNKNDKPLKIASFTIAFDWLHGRKLSPAWFFDCVAFAYAADAVEKFLQKGKRILITEGYLQQQKWKNKEGKNMTSHKIVVEDFFLLDYNKTIEGKSIEAIAEQITDDDIPY